MSSATTSRSSAVPPPATRAIRLDEGPHLSHALLEQVADAAGARRQQLLRVDGLDVLRQDQHPEAITTRTEAPP